VIIHETRVPYVYGDEFTIKPLYDVHYGNTYCDTKALKAYLADCDDKTYIIGGGDSIDAIITKDFKRYMKHSDATETDAVIDEQVDGLYEILAPYKERFIGLMDGNHEHTITKHCGTNPMRRLSEKLGCVHLGYSCFVRLVFHEPDGGRVRTITIKAHHGWGGGTRTEGGSITKYSKDKASWVADMFMYGHDHRLQSTRSVTIGAGANRKMVTKHKFIFLCGSYLKTLSDTTDATYSEIGGYPPIEVGGISIKIKPSATWVEVTSDV